MLKSNEDPLSLARRASWISALAWSPFVLVAWLWAGRPGFALAAWELAIASAILEGAYFVFLSMAYRRGSLTAVYAVARGTAPLLAVMVGVVILGEHLAAIQIVGIAALLSGIWLVRRPRPAGSATLPALATGVTIAAYSAIDSVGVHHALPWLYGFVVWSLSALVLVLMVPALRVLGLGRVGGLTGEPPASKDPWWQPAVVGMLMTSTFLIILIALRLAPLAIVSPLRESAIVVVALWGVWSSHERDQIVVRLAGACAVVAGAALLAFS